MTLHQKNRAALLKLFPTGFVASIIPPADKVSRAAIPAAAAPESRKVSARVETMPARLVGASFHAFRARHAARLAARK